MDDGRRRRLADLLAKRREIARLRTIFCDGGLEAPQRRIPRKEVQELLRRKLEQNTTEPPPF